MKEIEFKKGIEAIKNIKLEVKEKDQMLKAIFSTPTVSPYSPKIWYGFLFKNSKNFAFAGVAALILVLVGGLTFYKAEGSLPGDTLYPLKVNVSEPALDLLNIQPEQKAEWESVKAVRRLDEAVDLAVKGKLTEKTRTDLEVSFNKHLDAFDASLAKTASSSPQENLIKIQFEENVSAHTRVFKDLSGEKNLQGKTEELKKFEQSVTDKLKNRKDRENLRPDRSNRGGW